MQDTVIEVVRKKTAIFNVDLLLFFLIITVYGYFHGAGGWNQISRFDAMLAFAEPHRIDSGTFRIDRFMTDPERNINTGDWSYYNGHYYSNKAPGTMLLGGVIYFVLYHAERLLGIDPSQEAALMLNLYLINLLLSGALGALAMVAFRRFLLHLGSSSGLATGLSLVLAFTTILFPYSTQLWGHPTATWFILLALFGLTSQRPLSTFLSGFFAGMAVLSDYLSAVVAFALIVVVAVKYRAALVWFLAGSVLPAVAFFLYHNACFGSCLALATDYSNPQFHDEDAIMKMFVLPGPHNIKIAGKLLFSLQRGLIVQMPVLLFSLVGMVYWLMRSRRDPLLWASAFCMVALLIVNSSFNGWHGGASVSARYQIVALPFWILCIRELPWKRVTRVLFIPVAVWSGINMLVLALVTPLIRPFAAHFDSNPLYGWAYGTITGDQMAIPRTFRFDIYGIEVWSTCNFGTLLGLRGSSTLLPLFAVAVLACLLYYCVLRGGAEPGLTNFKGAASDRSS